jgi:hypothetical protein
MFLKVEQNFYKEPNLLLNSFKLNLSKKNWDFFKVKNQYKHLRTPAHLFFPKKVYAEFHKALVEYGRSVLGCHDVSPPWLSCYVDGCYQNIHADVPHGPYAFVYSITHWEKRDFEGGETFFLKEQTLDYWSLFSKKVSQKAGIEENDLVKKIKPKFNQLLLFDGRIPHGVVPVRGTENPEHGRLVIHGWFVKPRPFLSGPLSGQECQSVMAELNEWIGQNISARGELHGNLTFKLDISPSGNVIRVRNLPSTLRSLEKRPTTTFSREISNKLKELKFPKKKASTQFTVPFCFE